MDFFKSLISNVVNFFKKYVLHTNVEWSKNNEQHSETFEEFAEHRKEQHQSSQQDQQPDQNKENNQL